MKTLFEELDNHQNFDNFLHEMALIYDLHHNDGYISIENQFDVLIEAIIEDNQHIHEQYRSHIVQHDFRFERIFNTAPNIPLTNDILFSDEEKKNSVVWDFLCSYGSIHQLISNLTLDNGLMSGIAYTRMGNDAFTAHKSKWQCDDFDKSSNPKILFTDLKEQFHLSRTEFKVVESIMQSNSLGEISNERNVSYETVRTQTKSILAKCNCANQKQLIALLRQFMN